LLLLLATHLIECREQGSPTLFVLRTSNSTIVLRGVAVVVVVLAVDVIVVPLFVGPGILLFLAVDKVGGTGRAVSE